MKTPLPGMEQAVTTIIWIMFVLGMNSGAGGFPVYDYDPATLRDALRASVDKVNLLSLSPYLFRVVQSSLKRVAVVGEDSETLELEFRVRETMCMKDSGADPNSCDFQRVPSTKCRSTAQVSAEQVKGVWVRCHWASSSESSSEERFFGELLGSFRRRSYYQPGLFPDEPQSGNFYGRSYEIMRRRFPPVNRRFQNQRHQMRMNGNYE